MSIPSTAAAADADEQRMNSVKRDSSKDGFRRPGGAILVEGMPGRRLSGIYMEVKVARRTEEQKEIKECDGSSSRGCQSVQVAQ
jgi:hypothetical protein